MKKWCQYIFCCSCCADSGPKGDQKKKDLELKTLESITQTSSKDSVWTGIKDPSKLKAEHMTKVYVIPNKQFKTEQDVFQYLGYTFNNRQIDSGSFGTILTAFHNHSKLKIAIKKMTIPEALNKKMSEKREDMLNDVKNELFVLQTIKHPHVVRLIQHFMIRSNVLNLYILMQFAENGNLEKMSETNGPFEESQCKLWFAQMLNALVFMHKHGIAHRDLKLANILLDSGNDVLIADFGLSRLVWRQSQDRMLLSSTYCGTPPYMAPEVLVLEKLSYKEYDAFKADVWSLGVILFVMFSKVYPFPKHIKRAMKHMNKRILKFPENRIPTNGLKDLLSKMFEPDFKSRIRMGFLRNHKWIRNVYKTVDMKSKQKIKENALLF